MMLSGSPGNSLMIPLANAMIIGSAILEPWIQPGKGSSWLLSMIAGLTITSGTSSRSLTAIRSARDFVKV